MGLKRKIRSPVVVVAAAAAAIVAVVAAAAAVVAVAVAAVAAGLILGGKGREVMRRTLWVVTEGLVASLQIAESGGANARHGQAAVSEPQT